MTATSRFSAGGEALLEADELREDEDDEDGDRFLCRDLRALRLEEDLRFFLLLCFFLCERLRLCFRRRREAEDALLDDALDADDDALDTLTVSSCAVTGFTVGPGAASRCVSGLVSSWPTSAVTLARGGVGDRAHTFTSGAR
jgi:hypothetical protein